VGTGTNDIVVEPRRELRAGRSHRLRDHGDDRAARRPRAPL